MAFGRFPIDGYVGLNKIRFTVVKETKVVKNAWEEGNAAETVLRHLMGQSGEAINIAGCLPSSLVLRPI